MQRQDPFFATKPPHKNAWLESMHRTYQAPKLPQKDDQMFARAMHFRNQEKAKYKVM